MGAAIALGIQVAGMIPTLIQAGIDIYGLWEGVKKVRDENRAPTDEEWQKLNAMCEDLEARFDAAAQPRPPGS